MGRLILQMMISADGMVSGPNGELDWIAHDTEIEQGHLDRLESAEVMIIGAGLYPEMPRFWRDAAANENAEAIPRAIGRAMNKLKMVVYSHKDMHADQPNDEVHVVVNDEAFVSDVQRLKEATKGTIITYGGVRLARSLLQQDLVNELHLDICPVILGEGQPLFTGLEHRTQLRLMKATSHESGTTEMHYEVVKG